MGRKKKRIRPIIFCYYCDRIFENERVLIQHQRAKHFKCPRCHKRVNSANGMMVHMFQVHMTNIESVPAAKEGRDSFDIEIFGMDGVPADIIEKKRLKIYGQSAKKQKVSQHQQMWTVQSGIQIPGTRNVFNPFEQVSLTGHSGVMPVVGMPMYARLQYPGMTQILPQPVPVQPTVRAAFNQVAIGGPVSSRLILDPPQALSKPGFLMRSAASLPGSLTALSTGASTPRSPQDPPSNCSSPSSQKALRGKSTPPSVKIEGAVKENADSSRGTHQSSPSEPKTPPLRQKSSNVGFRGRSIAQGKAPIIPCLPKPKLELDIVRYNPPPVMPIIKPQGPPPMHPPPNFSLLPDPPLSAPPVPPSRVSMPKDAPKKKKNTIRIYGDDRISQEEKRAMHPKYSAQLTKRITSLSQSIDERLKSLR